MKPLALVLVAGHALAWTSTAAAAPPKAAPPALPPLQAAPAQPAPAQPAPPPAQPAPAQPTEPPAPAMPAPVPPPASVQAAPGEPAPAAPASAAPIPRGPVRPPELAMQVDTDSAYAASGVDHRISMWRLEMGYRGSFVTNAGYNPFSTQDYFSQFSVAATRTLIRQGSLSFAPGIAWDYGNAGASARGDATSFSMHRLSVPLEGRLHFGAWGYAFLRAAPGLALERAEVDDSTSPAPLTKTAWQFSTDVSAGYAWLVVGGSNPHALEPRMWLQGDAGYGWVAGERLALAADLPSGSPQGGRVSGIDLGTLTMQGAFFRVAVAMSF